MSWKRRTAVVFGRVFGRPGRSLTRRLIWLASAWILVALVLTGSMLTSMVKESGLRRLSAELAITLDEVLLATDVQPGQITTQPIQDARSLRIFGGSYWAVLAADANGQFRPATQSESLHRASLSFPEELPDRLREASGTNISYNAAGPDGAPVRVAATLKIISDRPVIFMAAVDRSDVEQDTRQFATVTWVALLILGLGLVSAVFLQVRVGLQPLFLLRNEIIDVRKGRSPRIANTYPLEIQPLAEQVNQLLDHNTEVVERQRTHVGNLAHALKTPLSVMLAEAEGREDGLADVVTRQSRVMKDQVDHHLRRARAAARAQGLGERTPVAEVLDEMAVMLERVFASRGVEIDWRAPDDLLFRGERQDLQEILGNLMENACKWSKRRVRITAEMTGIGQMGVVVEDDGPGLEEDQLEAALKRGARMDEDTPGTGLGLSIVDDLTRAYNGKITLGRSAMGGLKATLELPAVEA